VRVITPIETDGTISSAEKMLDEFVREMEPVLVKYLENRK